MNYATNPDKTEQAIYVSGVNCIPDIAAEQFADTKQHWQKSGGVTAYHVIQSFAEGEVDAETAHEIGVKLAEEVFGDRFEVIVATHLNTDHVHNHLIINSVSFVDGKKYDDSIANYYRLRDISDRLCREYGLSIIENPEQGQSMNYAEWRDKKNGMRSVRDNIRETIDVAIRGSITVQQFLHAMNQMGYIIDQSGKYAKIKQVGADRFVRFSSLGEGYDVDDIKRRIYQYHELEFPERPPQENPKHIFDSDKPVEQMDYSEMYRCFEKGLTTVRERPATNRRMNFILRDELYYERHYSDEYQLVSEHGIKNAEELAAYRAEAEAIVAENKAERQKMYNALRRAMRANDLTAIARIRYNIQIYNMRLDKLRREIRTCDGMMPHAVKVQEKLMRIQQDKCQGKDSLTYDVGFARLISDQVELVSRHGLKSLENVKAYRHTALEEIQRLAKDLDAMYTALPEAMWSKNNAYAKLNYNIEVYQRNLKLLRTEIRACDGIIAQANGKNPASRKGNVDYGR